jgi:hypothetical protein
MPGEKTSGGDRKSKAGKGSIKAKSRETPEAKPAPIVKVDDVYESIIRERGEGMSYSEAIADEICTLIALRVPLARICARPEFPSEKTIYRWKLRHPEFVKKLDAARRHRAEARAERIDEIIDEVRRGEIDPQAARVIFDAERWQAGKELPAKFGDRTINEHSGPNGQSIAMQVDNRTLLLETARWVADVLSNAPAATPELPPK